MKPTNKDNVAAYTAWLDRQTKFDIGNFEIVRGCWIGNYIVAHVKYINYPEYNGDKVLVWKGLSKGEFYQLKQMDPQFSPSSALFATFKPYAGGYNAAITMVSRLQNVPLDTELLLKE